VLLFIWSIYILTKPCPVIQPRFLSRKLLGIKDSHTSNLNRWFRKWLFRRFQRRSRL